MTPWLLAVALLVALTPASLPATSRAEDRGQDLRDRKNAVARQERRARQELDQSTARLARAVRRLEEARRRLDLARDVYREARGQRVAAALVDERARADLADAETDLADGQARLAQTQDRIGDQEDLLRGYAVESFQSGDPALLSLSMVLTTGDPSELMGRLGSMSTLVDRQAAAISRLDATRALLEVERLRLQAARDVVAQRRARAAETLAVRRTAEARAVEARGEVRRQAETARELKQAAREARRDDLRRLRQIRRERARVERLLRRHYAQQQRREVRAPKPPNRSEGMPWPVRGWVSSPFGMRKHPVYGRWTLHDGIDIAAPCGRRVWAAARGVVVASYYSSAYGNRVVIAHGLRGGVGLATTYNHMRRSSVRVGERVRRGDVVGRVGSTGLSTGCHVHFSVLRDGRPVNPAPWLR